MDNKSLNNELLNYLSGNLFQSYQTDFFWNLFCSLMTFRESKYKYKQSQMYLLKFDFFIQLDWMASILNIF